MALSFNGTSHYAKSASALAALSGKSRIAIGFWIYTTFNADDDMLLELSPAMSSNAGSFMVLAKESGSSKLWFDLNGNVGRNVRTKDVDPTSSAWHHILWNINFGNAANTETENVIIDGTTLTLSAGLTVGAGLNSENTGTFGSYVLNFMSRNGASLFADGLMADPCIWAPSSAISGADVTRLAAGRRAATVRNSEILYNWPMVSDGVARIGGIDLAVTGATPAADPPTLDSEPAGWGIRL